MKPDETTPERPRSLGIRHVALNVRDVERSIAFYRDVLGYAIEWRPDPDNAYMTSGPDNLALHRAPEGVDPSAPGGLDHFGIAVATAADVDRFAGHVARAGARPDAPPRTHRDGARSFYVRDPDGHRIQVIHHPPIARAEQAARPAPRENGGGGS